MRTYFLKQDKKVAGSRLRACPERSLALPELSSFVSPVFRIIEEGYGMPIARGFKATRGIQKLLLP